MFSFLFHDLNIYIEIKNLGSARERKHAIVLLSLDYFAYYNPLKISAFALAFWYSLYKPSWP